MANKELPICPLMSAGASMDMVCTLDRCAWYIPSTKKCSVYMMAHNALLEITSKQQASKK